MEKPNLLEEVIPCSGHYSFKRDLRLNAWLGVAIVVYLSGMYLVKEHPDWSPWLRGVVAALPIIPGALYGRGLVRFFRGLDELQRRVQTEACFFATVGTLIVTTVVNTLNAQAVPTGPFAQGLGLGAVFMVLLFFWSIGTGIATCRYK